MQVRGVVLVTIALFVGIAALVLHLLAICSPHWKITKRDREPVMTPVSYGLWERCENRDIQVLKQGVALGSRPNVQVCWPNRYMRYSPAKSNDCYHIRRHCPFIQPNQIPAGCACRYLPSAKASQWLTILAAVCLVLGLLLLYLKTITQPQNESAVFLLSYAPFICFLITLILMVTGLIVLGAFLRRDTYEDYSFPLRSVTKDTKAIQSFELHSLRNYAKYNEATFSRANFTAAADELREDANTHYHTIIGRATFYEITATILIFVVTLVTFWLGTAARSDDN